MDEWFWRAGLSLALSVPAGLALRHLRVRAPAGTAVLEIDRNSGFDLIYRPVRHQSFVRSTDQGNFGEILTAMMMAARGWWSINGKVNGSHGIDGIFIRPVDAGWQACLIETKTNSGKYRPRQMSDEKLLGDLDRLYLTAPATLAPLYGAIHHAVRTASPAVRKELWRHALESGHTQAFTLASDGVARDIAPDPSAPAMMRALYDGLDLFDYQRTSIQPSET